MNWLQKLVGPRSRTAPTAKGKVPEGLWEKCEGCGAVLYKPIGAPLLQFDGYEATFARFTEMVHQYGGWLMLAFAFLPIPYKVATIAAGSVGMSIPVMVLASIAGRGGRFFLVAFLMRAYGDLARQLIDDHFNKLALIFTGLLVGGFVVVHYAV
mgnify:CR=1 FL=1